MADSSSLDVVDVALHAHPIRSVRFCGSSLFSASDELRDHMGLTDGFNKAILKAIDRYFELFGHRRFEEPFVIPEDPQWEKELWGQDLSQLQRPRSQPRLRCCQPAAA